MRLLTTYLEMLTPPAGPVLMPPEPGARAEPERLSVANYLPLYEAVGAPVSWDQRILMTSAALDRFLADPATEIVMLRVGGEAVGFCEAVRGAADEVEIVHFGLLAKAQGRRLGPYLLDVSLRLLWREGTRRGWLHTDSNDHPGALRTYLRAGFVQFDERWEVYDE